MDEKRLAEIKARSAGRRMSVERLTKVHVEKGGEKWVGLACNTECAECAGCEDISEALSRLAAYEDTGLTPEEINKLQTQSESRLAASICNAAELSEAKQVVEELRKQLAEQERNYRLGVNAGADAIKQLKAELAESQRRERAAVEDLKLIVDAVREAHCDETCCFACKFDCDTSITDSGCYANECPGFERDDCFEWRGPVAGEESR